MVIAEDLEAGLVYNLRDNRVYLTRHDGGSSLAGRQVDLSKASAWTGRQQAQVITDLGKLHCCALDGGVQQHVSATVRGCFDEIASGLHLQAGDLRQGCGDLVTVASRGVHAGADCGCTQVDLEQAALGIAQQCLLLVQVIGKALELITQGHRNGILKLSTAHLQDVLELIALDLECGTQTIHALNEVINCCVQTQAEAGRVSIVGGLGHVHIIVRVDDVIGALLLTEVLQCEVGNNLVGVHVQRGTSTTLEDVQRELIHAATLF